MKTTTLKTALRLAFGAVLALGAAACSPDEPSNEKQNKLHEDPVRAVFTLQEGTLKSSASFDAQPRQADFQPSATPAQVIEWQTTATQGWHVTSQADRFKVKNAEDNPDLVYYLKMDYYNAKGEKMNNQFFDLGQDKIHQHFFSMYKEVEFGGSKGSVRVSNKAELPYDYRYADELNGTYIGQTNPMGFDGFLRFLQPGKAFTLSVDLLHAASSKFDDKGQPSPFYLPAKVLLSTGLWDINVKLPVEIDGTPAATPGTPEPLPFKPHRVEIEIYDGHLHGPYSFHQNPLPKQIKYMGINYKLGYTLEDGKWVADESNPKTVNLIGSKEHSGASAFSLRYYDKQGNDMTDEIVINGEDQHYQHFFVATGIEPGYGGVKEATDVNGTDFFDYLYCDTAPWNKTHKFDKARFIGKDNPIGIKGYFAFLRSHKKFNIEIRLMRARKSKFTDGKASPFCQPTDRQLKEESWMPAISVPMNIYMDAAEKEVDEVFVDDPSELSLNEADYSASSRTAIRSLMEAFGLTNFETALAEFFWIIKGDRKEDNTGFWF